jgi:hypothetical protein
MTTSGAQQGIRPGVCLSTSRPASPYIGQVIYMTDVDQSAVWDGTSWSGLDRNRNRNVIHNGAMQIHQRGTSYASITANTYFTADRFALQLITAGTWTQSVENDAPTGTGFSKSLKMLCTTADASPDAGDILTLQQRIEGQNLQHFAKGTASAKPFTLSFWVKSNVTGTYIANLSDADNTRTVSAPYTISASATWEKKIITFPADTTGAFDNDNQTSLFVQFALVVGSNYTSGTLSTVWATTTNANRYVGQPNVASTVGNYWQVTGVQFEAGAVATPFEFEDYSTTLAKCQRYLFRTNNSTPRLAYAAHGTGSVQTTFVECLVPLPVTMRAVPTSITYQGLMVNTPANVSHSITALGISTYSTTTDIAAVSGNIATSVTAQFCKLLSDNNVNGNVEISADL